LQREHHLPTNSLSRLGFLHKGHLIILATSACLFGQAQPHHMAELAVIGMFVLVKPYGHAEITADAVTCYPGRERSGIIKRIRAEMTRMEQPSDIWQKGRWSRYVAELVSKVQLAIREYSDISKLRFLLYPSGLLPEDKARIQHDDAGVVWLG
jgi:hypothetical protein